MELKYCPQCGGPLETREIGGRERRICPDQTCGYVFWLNPAPVLAGLVEYGEDVILIQNLEWPADWWGLVTGFMESEETPEDGMLRELEEELGLKGEIQSLIGVYDFQRRNQVIIAYHIKASGEIIKGEELRAFKKVPITKLKAWPSATGQAVADWLAARRPGHEPS
jgi:NAD+ diphosphatase